jgi:hypothetical protein
MQASQSKRPEIKHDRLKRLVADLWFKKQVSKDITEKTEGPQQRDLQAPSGAGRLLK